MNRDWLRKDFYRLLEVGKDADQADIKKSYRRLAQKLHPDANPGDPGAAERFKEVSEAYTVLSDPARRSEYDQVREMGGGFGGGNVRFEDIIGGFRGGVGDLFGGFGGGGRGGPRRGGDVSARLDLTFEEAVKGVIRPVSVDGAVRCGRCGGNGAEPGTAVDVCGGCGGTGTVASNQGFFSFTNPCPNCGGSGRMVESPCTGCRGAGQERRIRNHQGEGSGGGEEREHHPGEGAGFSGAAGSPSGRPAGQVAGGRPSPLQEAGRRSGSEAAGFVHRGGVGGQGGGSDPKRAGEPEDSVRHAVREDLPGAPQRGAAGQGRCRGSAGYRIGDGAAQAAEGRQEDVGGVSRPL